jgi:hypothetical protein
MVTDWNGKYLISVDGYPRTVIDKSLWVDMYENVTPGTGTFNFCGVESRLGGIVLFYGESTGDFCFGISNPPVNLPNDVIPNDFRKISLPNKSANFGLVDPIPPTYVNYQLNGEALYAKKKFSTAGCSDIDNDGLYWKIVGTFPDGTQAFYSGNGMLEENTLENPIADGGNGMYNVKIPEYEEGYPTDPECPVPFKSFLNSK